MNRSIKSKKMQAMQGIASVSCLLLGLLVLALLSPMVREEALATCATGDGGENCVSTQATTELMLNLKTAIAVALDNQVEMEVTPRSDGATSYATTKLNVSTNSNDGYGLFLATGSKDGNLVSVAANNGAVISNTEQNNVLLSELGSNSYGYALESGPASDTTKYSHVPTESTVVKSTKSVTATDLEYAYGDTYYLSFGTKIGTDIPAGSYSGTVTVSAVANPRTIAYLSDLTYMQDMTKSICTNTREGYTKQLIDTRDGKSYWVAKLKDGNCWMTQNLAFTITQEMIDNGSINSTNTDIAFTWGNEAAWTDVASWMALGERYATWNYPGGYVGPSATSVVLSTSGYSDTLSFNLGEKVLTNPTSTESCKITNNDIATCNRVKDVAGWTPNYVATETNAIDEANKRYDAHYLIGNYYQYNTATAGTGAELTNDGAVGSICPRGWGIPTDVGDFPTLFYHYGMIKVLHDFNGTVTGDIDGKTYDIATAPLYFTRIGDIYDGKIGGVGDYGTYWSSVADGSMAISAYAMDFGAEQVNTSVGSDKNIFFPVRCVAR